MDFNTLFITRLFPRVCHSSDPHEEIKNWTQIYLPRFYRNLTERFDIRTIDFEKWYNHFSYPWSYDIVYQQEALEDGIFEFFINLPHDPSPYDTHYCDPYTIREGDALVIHPFSFFGLMKNDIRWSRQFLSHARNSPFLGIYKERICFGRGHETMDIVFIKDRETSQWIECDFQPCDIVINVEHRKRKSAILRIESAWLLYREMKVRKRAALIIEKYYLEHALKPVTGALYKMGKARFEQFVRECEIDRGASFA